MPKFGTIMSVYVVFVIVLASGIGYAQAGDPPAAPQWGEADLEKGYVVFEHPTMKNLPRIHVPPPEAIVDTVSCALARGEYEPIQIGVHALAGGLTNIRVTVVSALEVTVYHRIDEGLKQQLASDPDTNVISWLSSATYLQRGEVVGELDGGDTVNFWLLFRADSETSPGVHQGKIRIEPDGRAATELDLAVRVRPFELAAPRAVFGMWFREDMLPERFGSWEIEDQDALAIYRDMAAHGQNSVTFYHAGSYAQLPPQGSRMVDKSLPLAVEAGLVSPEIPVVAVQAGITGPKYSQAQMEAAVAWLETERRKRGWPEIIIMGWDEPPYPARGLRETYAPLRTVPIRLLTDTSVTAAYAYGDLHDVWTLQDGEVTPEMQAEARRMGAEVWTYSYRIWRQNFSPLCERYFAGLYTWAYRLGGNTLWVYSGTGHHSHVWWEPDSNEPMSVTGWEGRREGVDDYRYLQMVEDLVTAKTPDPAAIEAGEWLEALRTRLKAVVVHEVEAGKPLDIEEYDAIRATAADYIEKLGPVADPEEPPAITGLKDEAAAFRGKSVEQCVAGLDGSDVSQRRAAAMALFELGPQAAQATPTLARLLDDPGVRFPALRALEAIGPEAYPAASKIAALLSHPDVFVRLGATFTLGGIAGPRTWDHAVNGYAPEDVSPYAHTVVPALRQALCDSHAGVVRVAAYGLSRCGEAAASALPDAMKIVEGEKDSDKGVGTLRALAAMGPAAAEAVPLLVEFYAAAEGEDRAVTWTLAAIGPAASDALAVLEQYRTAENPFLADTCYALFCIRGEESELETMVGLLGDESRPRGSAEWEDVVRFLTALGAKAAPVAPLVRERLSLLDSKPSLQRQLELTFFRRVEEGGKPLRLLPR